MRQKERGIMSKEELEIEGLRADLEIKKQHAELLKAQARLANSQADAFKWEHKE